jgi:two-component system sensor histidine kinase YesM
MGKNMINKITSTLASKLMRAMKFYRNISIRKKLLLVLNIQILIPIIIISYFSFKSSEAIITNKSVADSNDILSLVELRLQDTLKNLNAISQDLSTNKDIYSVLINSDSNSNSTDKLTNYEATNKLVNLFQSVGVSRPEIESMCIVTNNIKFITYNSNSDIESVIRQNYDEIREKADNKDGNTDWFFDKDPKTGIVKSAFLVRMVINHDSWHEAGLLIIQINMDYLYAPLQGLESEVMQNITILSKENDVILCKNKSEFTNYETIIKEMPQNTKNSYVDKNNDIFVAYRTLSESKWKILTYIPLSRLYQDVGSLRNSIILLCLGAILVLSAVSMFMSLDMIKPINQLVKAMKGMDIDNISNSYIEIDRKDELGFLHKTFNTMTKEMDHLVTWIYKEQITRKEAEIKALQSQINPHFLFNTLESINWMARLNNVPEISETVSDLSALLEASIGRDDRLITIEEEFMYIDRYIALIKRRFEDKITLNKEVDPQVLYAKIPRLLIQPLIENAVYHGVENSREKGIITLVANIHEGLITIEVIDNGSGISTEDQIKLNKTLEMDNESYFKTFSSKKNKSIGIDNVNRRIKLFYGENYGVKLESKLNIYTKVSVTLPVQNHNIREGYYVQGSNN